MGPFLQEIEGILAPGFFSADAWKRALLYKPHPEDVIISTYPKCGTTWTQHIVNLIFLKGRPFQDAREFFRRSPFLEMAGPESAENMLKPGAIKTHLPYSLTPMNPEAKYIYVARNPKDVCVSLFNHCRNFPGYQFQDGVFDEFFEEFYHGRMEWGSYIDHLLGWYEHKEDPNVFFVTYESIKADHSGRVKSIASFLGQEYEDSLEEDPEVLERILEYSSVEYMKEHSDAAFTDMFGLPPEEIENDPDIPEGLKTALKGLRMQDPSEKRDFNFIRKGIVGDWRNYFSEEQSRKLDDLLREKAGELDLEGLFLGALKY